jgi:HEAT repeat protein
VTEHGKACADIEWCEDEILAALRSGSETEIKQALDQLCESDQPVDQYRDEFLRLRHAEDEMIRSDAIELLRDCLQPKDREWLLEAIRDSEDVVQLVAVRHAGKVFGKEDIPSLEPILCHDDEDVQAAGLLALWDIDPDAADTRAEQCLRQSEGAEFAVRAVLIAQGHTGHWGGMIELATESEGMKSRVLMALRHIGIQAPQEINAMIPLHSTRRDESGRLVSRDLHSEKQ